MTHEAALLDEISTSVAELAGRGGVSEERAFAAWYATNFLDVDEDDALDAAALDGPEDQSIDFLYTDHTNERVLVLQAHYPKNRDRATPKAKFDGLLASVGWIENPDSFASAGRAELAAAAQEAQPHLSTYEVSFGLVSLGIQSEQIERTLATTRTSARLQPFRFFYDHRDRVIELYKGIKAGAKGVPEDRISFVQGRVLEDAGQYGKAWVGSVAASELVRLHKSYGDRLFARNVRLFLGARKGGINEQIIETARTSPGTFWALNNGVTIVADTVIPSTDGGFKITRFSIVNGCQTTVSLARADAPSGANVLLRLVAANDSVVSDIVRYNNTQNAVRIWTVRAADQLQDRLRQSFAAIGIKYAPKPEKGILRGASDSISLDRLAQYLAARDPRTLIAAVKEKSELFDRHYQDIFPHTVRPEDVYLPWLLGTLAERERRERLATLQRQGTADKVLTALLGVAGTYWTVFCAARLVQDLNSQPLALDLKKLTTAGVQSSLGKYVRRGLDTYIDIAVDTYEPDEYRSVRSALRSPRFLQKFSQKLSNRVASMKREKRSLPRLDS